jgi:MtN3 and saliva related transmembrane protein
MNFWQILGTFGIVFTSAQLVPQVVKSLRTRSVGDLSIGLSVVVGMSALCWLIYGIHLKDVPLTIANGLNLIGAMILLGLKIIAKEPDRKIRDRLL